MQVIEAKHGGACYGVMRALEMAREAADSHGPVATLGPLIHNPQVVAQLEAMGVGVLPEGTIPESGTVIIRSHGITPGEHKSLENAGLPIIDATCPHVARAQKAAEALAQEGRTVIVVGESGHPEVEGLCAFATQGGADVFVVSRPQDIPEPLPSSLGVVVQTTQKRDALQAILAAIKAKGVDPKVKDTICSATRLRQEEAASLAKQVDAVVVIGGRNSSNTTRLAEICSEFCSKTYHIERLDEIQECWFYGCDTVGVTAGASTPRDQIDSVLNMLRNLSQS